MKRQTIELTPEEKSEFHKLPRYPNFAFRFWEGVCKTRGLDPKTVIKGTALPLNHGKHWCWPSSLKCS